MSWTEFKWADGVKALATRFNNIETGIKEALAAAAKPAVGANGTVTVGEKGKSRKIYANLVHDGTKTAFKIPHNLGSKSIECTLQSSKEAEPWEIVTSGAKIVAINSNEVEITFAAASTAGTVFWVSLCL